MITRRRKHGRAVLAALAMEVLAWGCSRPRLQSPELHERERAMTIPTIPYYEIVTNKEKAAPKNELDVKEKAVFVGHSPLSQQEQIERFYTVFSQPDGLDISGVEIAATAFANLLENKPVKPLESGSYIAFLFAWGFSVGVICMTIR